MSSYEVVGRFEQSKEVSMSKESLDYYEPAGLISPQRFIQPEVLRVLKSQDPKFDVQKIGQPDEITKMYIKKSCMSSLLLLPSCSYMLMFPIVLGMYLEKDDQFSKLGFWEIFTGVLLFSAFLALSALFNWFANDLNRAEKQIN